MNMVENDGSTLYEVLEVNETIEFQVTDVGGAKIVNTNDLIMRMEDAIHMFEKDEFG